MIKLSAELHEIRSRLMQSAMAGHDLTVLEQREIAVRLDALIDLAEVDEQELQVFRLEEAGRSGRQMVNDLASESLGNLMLETEKIVRPDFGGRKGD